MLTSAAQSQITGFPATLSSDDFKSSLRLLGKVRTMLTSSYRNGQRLGYIVVESYDGTEKQLERIVHSADIEVHTGKLMNFSQKQYPAYDATGRLSEIRAYEGGDELSFLLKFTYDTKGRLIERLQYNGSKKTLSDRFTYSYDDAKKEVELTKVFDTGASRLIDKYTYQYNDKNQWVKQIIYDKESRVKDSISYEYSKEGLLIKEIPCCKDDYFYTYDYKFDAKGNWIERIRMTALKDTDGKISASETLRTYRVITYFGE